MQLDFFDLLLAIKGRVGVLALVVRVDSVHCPKNEIENFT